MAELPANLKNKIEAKGDLVLGGEGIYPSCSEILLVFPFNIGHLAPYKYVSVGGQCHWFRVTAS